MLLQIRETAASRRLYSADEGDAKIYIAMNTGLGARLSPEIVSLLVTDGFTRNVGEQFKNLKRRFFWSGLWGPP